MEFKPAHSSIVVVSVGILLERISNILYNVVVVVW